MSIMIFISEKYHYDGSLIFIIRMKHPATKVQLTWSRSLATTVFLSAAKKASFILSSWTFTKSKRRGTPSGVLTFFFNFGRRSTCFSWKKKWYPNYIYQTNICFLSIISTPKTLQNQIDHQSLANIIQSRVLLQSAFTPQLGFKRFLGLYSLQNQYKIAIITVFLNSIIQVLPPVLFIRNKF